MTSRLVIAPNWIGDAVMSLPVLRALRRRHPGDRLAVLARSGPAAIYRAEGSAGEVLRRGAFLHDVALRARRRIRRGLAPAQLDPRRAARLPVGGAPPAGIRHRPPRAAR